MESLPKFTLTPQNIQLDIQQIINDNKKAINDHLTTLEEFTWDTVLLPLENVEEKLHEQWSVISHMQSVCHTPEKQRRAAADASVHTPLEDANISTQIAALSVHLRNRCPVSPQSSSSLCSGPQRRICPCHHTAHEQPQRRWRER